MTIQILPPPAQFSHRYKIQVTPVITGIEMTGACARHFFLPFTQEEKYFIEGAEALRQ